MALAEYFNGPDVVHHIANLGLRKGGVLDRERAERFLEIKNSLGIKDYMTLEEAKIEIRRRLERCTG